MKPTLVIGADHAGFALKEKLVHELCKKGYIVEDATPAFVEGDDFPDIGKEVAQIIASKKHERGILVCGSGVGMTIAANRIKGARAMLAHDVKEVQKACIDDMVNILCFSGWNLKPAIALKLIDTFLKTKPSKAARHIRRIKKLDR
jgi:ribose 5-phosphate isomerase B